MAPNFLDGKNPPGADIFPGLVDGAIQAHPLVKIPERG